jgi:translation initiation factor 2 gamma subunit (eIF-2gamma)
VVLNKIDMLPEDSRESKIEKMKVNLMKTVFSKTKFKSVSMIPISVSPKLDKPIGIDLLLKEFEKFIPDEKPSTKGQVCFLF